MADAIVIADNVTMSVADQADFDELNADLRDADRAECRVFGGEGERMGNWQAAWAVRVGGDLVCLVGWTRFFKEGDLSCRRLMLTMSTNKVWKHQFTYIKYSKDVFREMCRHLPEGVNHLYSMPMSAYTASIEWQIRVLGFRRLNAVMVNGIEHTMLGIRKEEVFR